VRDAHLHPLHELEWLQTIPYKQKTPLVFTIRGKRATFLGQKLYLGRLALQTIPFLVDFLAEMMLFVHLLATPRHIPESCASFILACGSLSFDAVHSRSVTISDLSCFHAQLLLCLEYLYIRDLLLSRCYDDQHQEDSTSECKKVCTNSFNARHSNAPLVK
jgi:hypothetical protein